VVTLATTSRTACPRRSLEIHDLDAPSLPEMPTYGRIRSSRSFLPMRSSLAKVRSGSARFLWKLCSSRHELYRLGDFGHGGDRTLGRANFNLYLLPGRGPQDQVVGHRGIDGASFFLRRSRPRVDPRTQGRGPLHREARDLGCRPLRDLGALKQGAGLTFKWFIKQVRLLPVRVRFRAQQDRAARANARTGRVPKGPSRHALQATWVLLVLG